MPSEQVLDFRNAKPPADQYAAATLYRLLTKQSLYEGPRGNQFQLFRKILEDTPVPLSERRHDLPAGLSEAVHKALDRDPQRRYPDVTAFREALLSYAEG